MKAIVFMVVSSCGQMGEMWYYAPDTLGRVVQEAHLEVGWNMSRDVEAEDGGVSVDGGLGDSGTDLSAIDSDGDGVSDKQDKCPAIDCKAYTCDTTRFGCPTPLTEPMSAIVAWQGTGATTVSEGTYGVSAGYDWTRNTATRAVFTTKLYVPPKSGTRAVTLRYQLDADIMWNVAGQCDGMYAGYYKAMKDATSFTCVQPVWAYGSSHGSIATAEDIDARSKPTHVSTVGYQSTTVTITDTSKPVELRLAFQGSMQVSALKASGTVTYEW